MLARGGRFRTGEPVGADHVSIVDEPREVQRPLGVAQLGLGGRGQEPGQRESCFPGFRFLFERAVAMVTGARGIPDPREREGQPRLGIVCSLRLLQQLDRTVGEPDVQEQVPETQRRVVAIQGQGEAGGEPGAVALGQPEVRERHRHRYEVDVKYRDKLEEAGLCFSAMSPDGRLPEIVEWTDHPWFIGCQFHPEFTSTPRDGHPLFTGFIEAALRHAQGELPAGVASL